MTKIFCISCGGIVVQTNGEAMCLSCGQLELPFNQTVLEEEIVEKIEEKDGEKEQNWFIKESYRIYWWC